MVNRSLHSLNWQASRNTYVGRGPHKAPERKRPMDGRKDTNELVFVYGTLKKDQSNHRLLESSRYVDRAKTIFESYNMYDGGFPYVSYDEYAGRIVWGEIYLVNDPDVMRSLDQLEGVPHHYVRHITTVHMETVDLITTPSLKPMIESRYGDRCFRATMYVASEGVKARLNERHPMTPWASWPKDEEEEVDNNVPRPIPTPWSTPALHDPWIEVVRSAPASAYDLEQDMIDFHNIAVNHPPQVMPQVPLAFWQRWGGGAGHN